ncbi:arylamine N-acetyltransferase [Acinetobacter sp. NIPH 2699]|uniref:arylamine N-acetyltransferase family protein n=1 Tax=Acinetobacter sp. NIPH 2699 TaxID=2923433 RepID=UPI001F4AB28E|nr:arylamine N-acetyltransferase [Acinetobacter sp. NIPH 2699]MCH7337519.1 arylamine N-acetyltransferase [Acinetobacter sp. NIPH 2699]
MKQTISAYYLNKLGFEGDFVPTQDNLKTLLSLHVQHIPFGNISSFLGEDVSLDPDQLAQKLLLENREGYCLEHSTLTRIALTELGYDAYNVLGRVYYQSIHTVAPVRTHLVTLVRINQQLFLYDPGFGGMTPTTILSFEAIGEMQPTALEPFKFVDVTECGIDDALLTEMKYMLQVFLHDEWVNVYAIHPEQKIAAADAVIANWYISTSPESLFTQHLMLFTANSDTRMTLKDRVLRVHGKERSDKKVLSTFSDFEETIKTIFQIDINQDKLKQVWEKLALNQ